jgi:hypothetical protein
VGSPCSSALIHLLNLRLTLPMSVALNGVQGSCRPRLQSPARARPTALDEGFVAQRRQSTGAGSSALSDPYPSMKARTARRHARARTQVHPSFLHPLSL